jgi:hypothetical protein
MSQTNTKQTSSDVNLRPLAYHVVRYAPNLVRDEWINIGVLLIDPTSGRAMRRLIEEPEEFARVRRLHPAADQELLRRLPEEFDAQLEGDAKAGLARLDRTLSNAVQLSPQKGLLAEDMDAELERLYRDHIEAPRYDRVSGDPSSRSTIRSRANQVFRTAGIWPRLERRLRVDEFTFQGDPMRLDYSYRRNGTRGFVQVLSLGRDPGQAKVLAFTADAIRTKLPHTEFLAVTEMEPHPQENARHRFVTGLLAEREIPVLPLGRLAEWAYRLRPTLLGNGN